MDGGVVFTVREGGCNKFLAKKGGILLT